MTPDDHRPFERPMDPAPHPAPDDPVLIGSELRHVETALCAALRDEADTITPSHRLDAILAAGHAEAGGPRGRHRWLMPVAAAAAVVVVVGGVLVVRDRQTAAPPVVGGPTISSPVGAPSFGLVPPSTVPSATGPSSVPTQSATPPVVVPPPTTPPPAATTPPATTAPTPTSTTTSAAPPTAPPTVTPTAVPVYYVGTRAGHDVLFREFVTADVKNPASPTTTVEAAVRTAMGSVPAGSGYVAPWAGVDLVDAQVTADGIRLRLARGLTGLAAARAKVAVQQLVWTAQAALGQGAVPVSFTLADGGRAVAPGQPASAAYDRPTDPGQVYALLSPLWIDSPTRGQVVRAGSAVTATGLASTNEANVAWQLLQGQKVVSKGAVTAEKAAPARGGFSIDLGRLSSGDYVIRVFEQSAKDGSVSAEQRMPFTVK